jgi:hypothetical protein
LLPLSPDFRFDIYHLLGVEVNGRNISLWIDDHTCSWKGTLAKAPAQIALSADQTTAVFAGFSLTVGWQDDFAAGASLESLEWVSDRPADWIIQQQQLTFNNPNDAGLLQKDPYMMAYELVVNARLVSGTCYGIAPAQTAGGEGPLLTIEQNGGSWAACWQGKETTQLFPLPNTFDPTVYQQFRLRKENGRLTIHWEQYEIATLPVTTEPTRIGLYGRRATAAFDLVRVTAVTEAAQL